DTGSPPTPSRPTKANEGANKQAIPPLEHDRGSGDGDYRQPVLSVTLRWSKSRDLSHALRFCDLEEPTVLRPAPRTPSQTRKGLAYIIPPMSPMPLMAPAMPAPAFSGGSATIASVIRMFFAIEAAFCSAERVTIVGSM